MKTIPNCTLAYVNIPAATRRQVCTSLASSMSGLKKKIVKQIIRKLYKIITQNLDTGWTFYAKVKPGQCINLYSRVVKFHQYSYVCSVVKLLLQATQQDRIQLKGLTQKTVQKVSEKPYYTCDKGQHGKLYPL